MSDLMISLLQLHILYQFLIGNVRHADADAVEVGEDKSINSSYVMSDESWSLQTMMKQKKVSIPHR